MKRSILVIWNPRAGRAEEASEALNHLEARGDVEVFASSSDQETRSRLSQWDHDYRMVVAAGGDGTVNQVVNQLMRLDERPILGVLPMGTANDLCQSLAMPTDLLAAIDRLDSTPRSLDIGELETSSGSHYFANMATGGNSDRVTSMLTPEIKDRWGPLCYLRGAVPVLNDLKVFRVSLSVEGSDELETLELLNIMVANGRTNAGWLPVAPRASLEDGLLDLILIRDGTLTELAGLATRFAISDYLQSDQVIFRQVRELTVESSPPLRFSLDGDLVDEEPRRFRIHPRALQVIVGTEYGLTPSRM